MTELSEAQQLRRAPTERLSMSRRGLVLLVLSLGCASAVSPAVTVLESRAGAWGVGVIIVVWSLAAWRVAGGLLDPPRPQWVVRAFDTPLTAIWASGLMASPVHVAGGVATLLGASPVGIKSIGVVSVVVGALLAFWGVWVRRRWVAVSRLHVPLCGLAPQFHRYRIAHLSDLHMGSTDTVTTVRKWVHRANALTPDLVVITGDLVTSGTRFYAGVAGALAELHAPDGVLVINGNHDQWDRARWQRELQSRGLRVLLQERFTIWRGQAALTIAGLDCTAPIERARQLLTDGQGPTVHILLAHYPAAFSYLGEFGCALTLAGHTHGGQVALPWVDRWLNLTRLLGGPVSGLTKVGKRYLYVSRGLGTTGIPFRLGAAPEIALIELRVPAAQASDGRASGISSLSG